MSNDRYLHLVRADCPLPSGTHVVAYCRDSGGEDQERSILQQREVIQEYCRHHQLVLERIYADEAKQGSNTDKRSELNLMREHISHRFKQIHSLEKRKKHMDKQPFGLIVWKSNRIGRDSIETTYIKADLRLRGVTIVHLVSSAETGDPTTNALFEVLQQFQDEKSLQELSENSRRGLADLVGMRDNDPEFRRLHPHWPTNDGRYLGIMPGVLPMGFKAERIQVGVNQRKTRAGASETHTVQRAVPNHDNQIWERCQLAWKLRHEGVGIKEIMLATRLFKTPGGYSTFFANRFYSGDFEYGGNTYVDFVPAMVSREWYEQEQQQRLVRAAKRMKKPINPLDEPRTLASRHLLSGLVFCNAVEGEEHPMHADTVPEKEGKRTRWDFYMCTTKKNTKNVGCDSSRISAAALEEAVIDALMNDVLTPPNLRPIADNMSKMLSERNDDVMARIQAVQGQLDEIRKSINQLLDAIEKVGFSSSIQGRLAEREEEERKLIAQLVNLEDLIVEPNAIAEVSEQQINAWVAGIRQALAGDDVELARKAIRQFVAKVVVNEKAGTIYYTFPLSSLSRLGFMPHTDIQTGSFFKSERLAVNAVIALLYRGHSIPATPRSLKTPMKSERNAQIRRRFADGESLGELAHAYNISTQRVHQIIYRYS